MSDATNESHLRSVGKDLSIRPGKRPCNLAQVRSWACLLRSHRARPRGSAKASASPYRAFHNRKAAVRSKDRLPELTHENRRLRVLQPQLLPFRDEKNCLMYLAKE